VHSEIAVLSREVEKLEVELVEQYKRLAELKRRLPRESVKDYELAGWDGPVKLSELFRGKSDLIVIHNMGRGCRYCTLWADGFNGVAEHLADRSAFVVCSPDSTDVQKEFAAGRNWRFPMVSGKDSPFTQDMGFRSEKSWMPGVSSFHRTPDGKIERVARAAFGPFDPFNGMWHLMALLSDGVSGWEPQYRYMGPLPGAGLTPHPAA
jgi:predicted dithiol-disulfide oxidoreductase (DUF899 family)